jgi:hypothetical protein
MSIKVLISNIRIHNLYLKYSLKPSLFLNKVEEFMYHLHKFKHIVENSGVEKDGGILSSNSE